MSRVAKVDLSTASDEIRSAHDELITIASRLDVDEVLDPCRIDPEHSFA